MQKGIRNLMPCKNMKNRVCEAWYSVALNILEELNISVPTGIADLIKAK